MFLLDKKLKALGCKVIFLDIYYCMKSKIREILREYVEKTTKNGGLDPNSGFNQEFIKIKKIFKNIEKKLSRAYLEITGSELNLPKIEIKIDPNIKDGKIAGFNHPDNEGKNGVLGIKPQALNNTDYLEDIIIHELIHAAIGDDLPDHKEHKGLFKILAKKMGLPKERWD